MFSKKIRPAFFRTESELRPKGFALSFEIMSFDTMFIHFVVHEFDMDQFEKEVQLFITALKGWEGIVYFLIVTGRISIMSRIRAINVWSIFILLSFI